jgi:hypothetical protein
MRTSRALAGASLVGALAGVAFMSGVGPASGSSQAKSRLGPEQTVSIAALTMVAHPDCAPGACAPQGQGYDAVPAPGGGYGLLTGGGSYYAPLLLPAGARLTRLTLVAYDNSSLPDREVHAALLADKDSPPNAISISAVETAGARAVGYQRPTVAIKGPSATIRADRAYFLQVTLPDDPALLPVMVRVRYRPLIR